MADSRTKVILDAKVLATNLVYLALIFALIVIPRALQRFRLPAPLTSVALGLAAGTPRCNLARSRADLLITVGAILFLLRVSAWIWQGLWRGRWPLLAHLVLRSAVVAGRRLCCVYGGYARGTLRRCWRAAHAVHRLYLGVPRLGLDEDGAGGCDSKPSEGKSCALLACSVVLRADSMPRLAMSRRRSGHDPRYPAAVSSTGNYDRPLRARSRVLAARDGRPDRGLRLMPGSPFSRRRVHCRICRAAASATTAWFNFG